MQWPDPGKLLTEPLSTTAPARKFKNGKRAAIAADQTGIEMLVHLVPSVSRTRIEEVVADLFHFNDRDLPSVLQDVGDELAFHIVMRPTLKQRSRRRCEANAHQDPHVRSSGAVSCRLASR